MSDLTPARDASAAGASTALTIDKLDDCTRHGKGAGSELLVVEGDSAAESVNSLRHREWQAVLALQGKPMNTLEASRSRVAKSPPIARLIESIGAGWDGECDPDQARYDRIVLLADPDVDGIHIRSLLLLFFHTWMRPVLDAGMVLTARPPLWRLTSKRLEAPIYAWSDKQYHEVLAKLADEGIAAPKTERFRGLGNMVPEVLFETCLDPRERTLARLTADHAEAAIRSYAQMRAQLAPRPR